MRRQHRPKGMSITRGLTGLAVGALVAGFVATAHVATAQDTEIVEGGVYGWGGSESEPWTPQIDNSQAPFVDAAVAEFGDTGLIAVTADGDVVAEGDNEAVTSMPSSLADADVVAIEIGPYGASAVVTAQGEIITWNGAPEAPALTDAVDVEIGHQYGIAMKGDRTIEVWGHAEMVERAPDLSDVVRVVANQQHAVVVTGDGAVHTWGKNVAQEGLLEIPEEVAAATIVDVASGGNAAFALTDTGEVHGWGGAASAHSFPVDQAAGQVIALGDTTRVNRWLAATDQGELIAWGGGNSGANLFMKTIPEHLQGYEVLAMESGASQHAVILGEPLDTEPGPVTDPEILGAPVVGATLTGVHADFNFEPLLYTASWYVAEDADGTDAEVAGPPGEELTLTEDHEGRYITFRSGGVHPDTFEAFQIDSDYLGPVVEFGVDEESDIDGDAVVGQTLTGVPATFNADAEEETYAWLIDEDVIEVEPGESLSLTLTEDHVDAEIRFRTIGEIDGVDPVESVSDPVGPVELPPFEVDTVSVISGVAQVGQILEGTAATFTLEPDSVSYVWYADEVVIEEGVDGTELVLAEEHEGAFITFETMGEREDVEDPAVSMSEPFGPVAAADVPVTLINDAAIEEGVEPEVGQTLVGIPAEFDGSIDGEPVHEWLADGVVIEDADGLELELTEDHIGALIQFRTTVIEVVSDEPVSSVSEPAVGPVVDQFLLVEDSDITGTAEVGATLTGVPAVFRGEPDLEYAWLDADDEVLGTDTTLMLTEAHEGAVIRFVTTATRDGEELASTSDAVGPVVLPDEDDDDNGSSPTPPPGDDDEAQRCVIATPDALAAGSAHDITVDLSDCGDWAGQGVRVWLFSDPIDLGSATVGGDGTFAVTIPADVSAGAHQLAVYDAEGNLIGYADITLTGDGTGGSGSGLPATGYDGSLSSLLLAVLLVLAGGIALVAARMRRSLRI